MVKGHHLAVESLANLINKKIKSYRIFLILAAIFIATQIAFIDYVPIWDGQAYIDYCYKPASKTLLHFHCFGHSAVFNSFLFGLTQRIDSGNHQLVIGFNILLGLSGLICFYLILNHLYGDRLNRIEKTLVTFCMGLNPVFLANSIQPGADYVLPIYFTFLLLALFKQRFSLVALIGIMLAFTKETGFMIYSVAVSFYVIFFLLPKKLTVPFDFVKKGGVMVFPMVLFGIYSRFFPLHVQKDTNIMNIIMEMFKFNPTSNFFKSQFSSIYLINFNWVLVLFVFVAVIMQLVNFFLKKKNMGIKHPEKFYIYILIISITWFLTRVEYFNNPRYMLPVLPLFILLFSESIIIVSKKKWLRVSILVACLVLLYISSFLTFDPIAKSIFGVFKFGNHEILNMTSITGKCCGYGRDQLVYNFEFTQFHYFTEQIVNEIGMDKNYSSHQLAWILFQFNNITKKRTLKNENLYIVRLSNPENVLAENISEIYYINYPYIDNSNEIEKLSNQYDKRIIRSIKNGYWIDIYHFVLKPHMDEDKAAEILVRLKS